MEERQGLEVVERHITELKKLQDDYTEQIEAMEGQRRDFDVLIVALEKEVACLKKAEQQVSLDLVEADS